MEGFWDKTTKIKQYYHQQQQQDKNNDNNKKYVSAITDPISGKP